MIKPCFFLLCLSVAAAATGAEDADQCAGLDGTALSQCRANQETLRQQARLEQLLQQQQERQNQLDKQQREVQQELESMRLQNESLRRQLERDAANQAERQAAAVAAAQAAAKSAAQAAGQATGQKAAYSTKNPDLNRWKADNPWFGADYARTQFAMRYTKQLQAERPDLAGRELLDAVSAKVNETFGPR